MVRRCACLVFSDACELSTNRNRKAIHLTETHLGLLLTPSFLNSISFFSERLKDQMQKIYVWGFDVDDHTSAQKSTVNKFLSKCLGLELFFVLLFIIANLIFTGWSCLNLWRVWLFVVPNNLHIQTSVGMWMQECVVSWFRNYILGYSQILTFFCLLQLGEKTALIFKIFLPLDALAFPPQCSPTSTTCLFLYSWHSLVFLKCTTLYFQKDFVESVHGSCIRFFFFYPHASCFCHSEVIQKEEFLKGIFF